MLATLYRQISQGKRLPILLGILSTFIVFLLQSGTIPGISLLVDRLEFLVYDQRLRVMPRPQVNAEHRIVIVDIDEHSLQAEGQYPWNRIKVGRLVEKLRDYGVLVVGFDITFPEPDRNIRDLLTPIDLRQLDPAFNRTLETIEPLINADQYFANAMQSGIDVILSINFNQLNEVAYNNLPPSLVDINPSIGSRLPLHELSGFTGNIDVLQQASAGSGSMSVLPDPDGIVRRVPLVLRYRNALYPTLSLEMVRVFNFEESYELIVEEFGTSNRVTGVRIGKNTGRFEIPTNERAEVLVPYAGGSSLRNNEFFTYLSATDVLNDRIDPELLVNAMVLVGTSAPGLLDIRSMPMDQVYPGVEVHANMLNALLNSVQVVEIDSGADTNTERAFSGFQRSDERHFPYQPEWTPGALLVAILLLGILMSLLFPYLGPGSLTVAAILAVAGVVWSNFWFWANYKLDFPLVMLVILVLAVSTANMIYGFLSESLTRRTIKGMFDQYVPPAHIDSMLKNPEAYSFSGESKELTVLFSDIRGFTSISEGLSASQLKNFLNDFFTPLTGIIFEHHGTIDKYVGDLVMAFWGAPVDDPDHRYHAVSAALKMQEKVEALREDFASKNFPRVEIGVGLNSGMMNVGDMGSSYRRAYTVLGDSVNLASRLEGLTKFYGIKILVGAETVNGLVGFLVRFVDRVKVKGKNLSVDCYEPLCHEQEASEELKHQTARFHSAIEMYQQQNWDDAESLLRQLLANAPGTRLYELYLERIQHLRETPPPVDWDGSFQHTEK